MLVKITECHKLIEMSTDCEKLKTYMNKRTTFYYV